MQRRKQLTFDLMIKTPQKNALVTSKRTKKQTNKHVNKRKKQSGKKDTKNQECSCNMLSKLQYHKLGITGNVYSMQCLYSLSISFSAGALGRDYQTDPTAKSRRVPYQSPGSLRGEPSNF